MAGRRSFQRRSSSSVSCCSYAVPTIVYAVPTILCAVLWLVKVLLWEGGGGGGWSPPKFRGRGGCGMGLQGPQAYFLDANI